MLLIGIVVLMKCCVLINVMVAVLIECKIGLFADDSIIYNNIISVTDCKIVQSDLDALCL